MSNWRRVWEEHNGPIPKGMHIHHIIPRSEGGTDDIENLQLVTPEEHYDIHFERGDYGACALISDGIEREAPTTRIVQFDLDGYRVKEWDSISDAGQSIGKKSASANISNCCTYDKKSIYNYQWFYESEVGDIDYIGPPNKKNNSGGHNTSRKGYLDVVNGNVFRSQRKAAESIGVINGGGNWKNKCRDRFLEITKEEYKILKQLENE